ncbi:heavy metal translocating P-type ATPase [Natronobacterium texcoconense]|uniref:heavy metal translocating P-type ATPase n=1 Tax=Natronobacterium texcoconense TaxID=1095778 RepID=UPI000B86BEF6
MSDRRAERGDGIDRDERTCSVCGGSLSGTAVETTGEPFCSTGCRDVDRALEPLGPDEGRTETRATENRDGDEDAATTHFRVDGMHSATCESFLETVASARDGVVDVAASYVTETVRVAHDPDRISKEELRDVLSTVGYTAYLREGAADDGNRRRSDDATRRAREMSGLRKDRTEDMLEIRYVVGIVFGSFLLVPYLAVLYPVYLTSFADWGMLHLYEEAFSDFDGFLFFPFFFVVTGAVLYLTGLPLLRGAYVSLKLRRPNTHLLAALTIVAAFAYGTLAIVTGEVELYFDLTIAVAALVMAAVFYEATIKRRARNQLTELTTSQVDTARVYGSDTDVETTREIPVEDVESGDRLLVREGERVPVDGVLESACTVDEAVVTGESLPVSKVAGDPVVGGSVVRTDAAVVDVGEETTSSIDRITEAVWDLQSATHGTQRRADAVAAVLAPIVIVAAALVGTVAAIQGAAPTTVATAVLVTVIVASPWALGLAAPVSVGAGLREALEHGIVVFDESVLERLRDVDVVVFDKTGTLTTGEMTVLETEAPPDLLAAVGELEAHASHPVAEPIAAAFGGNGETRVAEFRSHGKGVSGIVDGDRILVGHPQLFRERGWTLEDGLADRIETQRGFGRLPIVVGRDGRAKGLVVVGDEPRNDWEGTLSSLGDRDVEVVVLTGDDETATEYFADHPAVDHTFAAVPPAGKTEAVRRLREEGCVAMVGDGTNDAPALAEADLGISLGSATALAADAADLAIVDDDLRSVERAFELAGAARRRIRSTLALALVYNVIVIPAALLGVLNPLVATGAVAVCSLLVVGNAARPLLS